MRTHQLWLKRITKLGLIFMVGVSMNTNAGLFGFGGDSWKEEVLLHDGQKIIVKRSQSYGGRHEIGQGGSISEQDITFTVPSTNQTITWTSEYSEDVGRANFELLALHIKDGIPYIVATPFLCPSYNKWGRPNPPYVIFKYDSKEWKRIPLTELPAEFQEINVVIDTREYDWKVAKRSIISAEGVKKLNSNLTQQEYHSILREPLKHADSQTNCPISTTMSGKLIAPEVEGKILYYNWWPLATDWLKSKYGENK
ncbi:MAG: hypothetical protein HKM00_09455 [Gallionella sp.]|nr:hypothetical protein [Gallionella sp.]